MQPLVSVIVNNFNKGMYLKRCLDSIYNQSYDNIELVFWDDNSTDDSVEIFNRWRLQRKRKSGRSVKFGTTKQLSLHSVPGFVPLGVTRWLALQMCTGKYIAICDSDDWWDCDKIKIQITNFPHYVGLSFTDCNMFDKQECYLGRYSENNRVPYCFGDFYDTPKDINSCCQKVYKQLLTKRNFIAASSVVFNRERLLSVLGSPTHYTSGEDYDWILKIASKYYCMFVSYPFVHYTVVDGSLTHSKRSSTRATWYEIDAVVSSYNRERKYKWSVLAHLVKLYCKLLWKQFVREKF